MAINELGFNQISTVLAEITSQATGSKVIAPVNTAEFITVATTALKTGYDPMATAISQVLSRTIFSIRPYNRKFAGLEVSNQRYGNHVRKLNIIDSDFEEDDRFKLTDGASVDQYIVKKPKVLQTNFYGANIFQKHITIYRDQLDNAFSSPDEFGRFLTMVMQNTSDMIEQAHETTARATINNLIGGTIAKNSASVVHLLTEYNALTGLSLTAESVYQPDNFVAFIKWMFARIKTLSQMMTERTSNFHLNVTDNVIMRHTPQDRQKIYLYQALLNMIDSSVLSGIFQENYMRLADHEGVNFWQAFNNPDAINVVPSALEADGSIATQSAVNQTKVAGVIFDEEAAGYTVINQWSQPTPFNARGGYYNQYWHFTDRYWNDFPENCVVLLLD